jgi:hypothetical protein
VGLISVAKARVLQGSVKLMLDICKGQPGSNQPPVLGDDLVRQCRENPALLDTIESFLTDEQIEWLWSKIKEEPAADGED